MLSLTSFCGGFGGPAKHERCPHTIKHAGDKVWTCTCDCHEEKT